MSKCDHLCKGRSFCTLLGWRVWNTVLKQCQGEKTSAVISRLLAPISLRRFIRSFPNNLNSFILQRKIISKWKTFKTDANVPRSGSPRKKVKELCHAYSHCKKKKKTQELHFTLYGSQLACQMLTFIKQKKTEQVWLIWKNCHASSPYKEPGTMA